MTGIEIVVAAIIGGVGWTFAEYVLHRFAMHEMRGRGVASREHGLHHARRDFYGSTFKKGVAAVITPAILFPIVWSVSSISIATAFCGGFMAVYLYYERLHRRAHTHAPTGVYTRWVRRHHFAHHFVSPMKNFGFITPFWDIVFRTRIDVDTIRVPRRLAMSWLVDDAGDIRPEFTGDYRIGRPRTQLETPAADDEKAAFDNKAPALI